VKMKNDSTKRNSLAYVETLDALSIRIEAHKRYSNFSMEDWIKQNITFHEGDAILDLGCGSGNLFPLYSDKLGERGTIVGIDQNTVLLEKARDIKVNTSIVLLNLDINQPLPLIKEDFDHVISTFAIYYVDEPKDVLEEIKRVLKKTGDLILIGPTDKNASELYEFNKSIFGFGRNEKVILRSNRLEKEFYPALSSLFSEVCLEKIPSKLIFPNKMSFVKYYMATLLFEESAKKAGFKPSRKELLATKVASKEISKEMVVLRGKKID